ncbi:MAG: hypothetical protein WCO96_04055 [Actinomycetes bacterium]
MKPAAPTVAAIVALLALTGCSVTTTQTKHSRIKLDRERELATRSAVVVSEANPEVSVEQVDLVRSERGSAVAVLVRNRSDKPLNDLPISVGVRRGDSEDLLNAKPGLPYFDTHLPAIAAGKSQVWVLPVKRGVPVGEPFARVGRATAPAPTAVESLPQLSVTGSRAASGLAAELRNPSDVPQEQLQVYAWATSGGRIVSAGRASVRSLSPGAKAALRIRLAGAPAGTPSISVPPTVYE